MQQQPTTVEKFTAYWEARSEYQKAQDEANALLNEKDAVMTERLRLQDEGDRLRRRGAKSEKIADVEHRCAMLLDVQLRYDKIWAPAWQRLHAAEEKMAAISGTIDWTQYDFDLFQQVGACVKQKEKAHGNTGA